MKIHWNWRRKTNVLKERYAWNHSHGLSSDRKQPVGTNMIFSCCRSLPLILQFIRNVLNYWDCIRVLHMQLSFWIRVQRIFCLFLTRIWNSFIIHGVLMNKNRLIAKCIIRIFKWNLLLRNKHIDFCAFVIWKKICTQTIFTKMSFVLDFL